MKRNGVAERRLGDGDAVRWHPRRTGNPSAVLAAMFSATSVFPPPTPETQIVDARVAMQRAQTREQDQARVRAAQRRAQQEWEEVMTASRAAQRQAAHSVDLTGSTIPFPDHDSDAVVSG